MLDNSHDTQEGQGIWLWTIIAGLTLFVMEFLLLSAMVPSAWEQQVSREELAALVEAVGPRSANAILERAAGWYDAAFIQTQIQQYSYRLLLPDPHLAPDGMEALAGNPFWPWLRGRLDVMWGAVAQAMQRVAVLLSWWPFFLIMFLAAWGDGWVRRRIRQHSFAYASPLAHTLALRVILWLLIGVGTLFLAPLVLPAMGVPLLGAIVAGLLGLALANADRRHPGRPAGHLRTDRSGAGAVLLQIPREPPGRARPARLVLGRPAADQRSHHAQPLLSAVVTVNLQRFLSTWDGVKRENRVNRVFIGLLIIANIGLAIALNQADRTVVLVPPVLNSEITIGRTTASQEAKDVWALFVVELLGHVTPTNAGFLVKALDPLLAADIRQEVLKLLDTQTAAIKRENVSLSFEPAAIAHDPQNENIYITGRHVTSGPGAQPVTIERTFVVRIVVQNYRPRVAYLDVYPGPARLSTDPAKPPAPSKD